MINTVDKMWTLKKCKPDTDDCKVICTGELGYVYDQAKEIGWYEFKPRDFDDDTNRITVMCCHDNENFDLIIERYDNNQV